MTERGEVSRSNEHVLCHQVLSERVVCEVRALAVLPTKELAQQVIIFPNKVWIT